MAFSKAFVVLTLILLFNLFQILPLVVCVDFEVGGVQGWNIPSSKDQQLYNEWASKNRFNVGDTLRKFYATTTYACGHTHTSPLVLLHAHMKMLLL